MVSLITAFGFSCNKRSSNGGDREASPPKRAKQETSEASGAAVAARGETGASQESSGNSSNSVLEITKQQAQQQISNRTVNESKPSAKCLSTLSASPPRTHMKPSATSPHRSSRPINAIGLVAIPNPKNHILCMTTVANARNTDSPQNSNIKQLFRDAIFGRTSNSSWKDANFVDLGIDAGAKGVSRKHIKVLRVNGLGGEQHDDQSVATAQSATTAQSGVSAATAQSTTVNPTVMIQVLPHPNPPKETIKVIIHRTRRNKRRTMDLKQNECKTLRVGDAIELLSDVNRCFCVVAFHNPEAGNDVTEEPAKAHKLSLEEREIHSKVDGVDQSQTQPLLQPDLTQEVVDVDKTEVEVADSKVVLSAEEREKNEPKAADDSVLKVKTESRVEVEASTESSVEPALKSMPERVDTNAVAESNRSFELKPEKKASTTDKAELSISPANSEGIVGESQGVPNPAVAKGDDVRVLYQLADAFGIEHEEW